MNSTDVPAAPYNLMQTSNTHISATITWNSKETNVTYTVYTTTNTSKMFTRTGIQQTSFTLNNLDVETDYTVVVTATNKCGDESLPSNQITVRVHVPGGFEEYQMHL